MVADTVTITTHGILSLPFCDAKTENCIGRVSDPEVRRLRKKLTFRITISIDFIAFAHLAWLTLGCVEFDRTWYRIGFFGTKISEEGKRRGMKSFD